MKFGEIRWIDFPVRGGREQQGVRPAIIWQNTLAYPPTGTVVVIPLTSQLATLRFGATYRLESSDINRLPRVSSALIFQIGATDIRRIRELIGVLDDHDIERIASVTNDLLSPPS